MNKVKIKAGLQPIHNDSEVRFRPVFEVETWTGVPHSLNGFVHRGIGFSFKEAMEQVEEQLQREADRKNIDAKRKK